MLLPASGPVIEDLCTVEGPFAGWILRTLERCRYQGSMVDGRS